MEPTARPDAYGEAFAAVYDDWYTDVTDAEATADFVAARAGSGIVIELGVGTGRLAAPLLDRGVEVIGIDVSASMLGQCAAKKLAGSLHLLRADMTRLPLRPQAGAALIAFNTLFNVTTEHDQQRVFLELSEALTDDGVVIVEALDLGLLDSGPATSYGIRERRGDGLTVVGTEVDPLNQRLGGHHVQIDDGGITVRSWDLRWAVPAEIDHYASTAGFHLAERYGDWDCRPSEPGGERYISVYRRRARAE